MCQAKCEADKQISALSETVSRLQQQLKCCQCERATLQDQLTKSQDEICRLQRKLTAADTAQQQLNEVGLPYTLITDFHLGFLFSFLKKNSLPYYSVAFCQLRFYNKIHVQMNTESVQCLSKK